MIGIITALVGSWLVHATEAPVQDDLGTYLYTWIPRGWFWTTIAQNIALGGVLMAMAGATLAFLFGRPLTWARAGLGAGLFAGFMVILFGVIPNQMLTLAQGPLEWTSRKILFTIPPVLVLGNDVSISYEFLKDAIVAGFATTNLFIVAGAMVLWQNYHRRKGEPKPTRISEYGRPIRVER